LREPEFVERPVSSIAYDVGFRRSLLFQSLFPARLWCHADRRQERHGGVMASL